MTKRKQGFAAMDPEKVKAIARLGGIAAHISGNAHEWMGDDAIEAGRKGGLRSAASKAAKKKLIERGIAAIRSDADFYRAQRAFAGLTPDQMNQPYGASGQTRAEILRGYEDRERACDVALDELKPSNKNGGR